MVYCISDIHGELDRFKAMLDLIHFSHEDTLYIIGDVIDRKPNGVDILRIIMQTHNMVMLLGNHEQMCLETLGPHNTLGARSLWKSNGGSNTYRELVYGTSAKERNAILYFIHNLPDFLDIEVDSRKFHLVHGMPGDNLNSRVWGRPVVDSPVPFDDRLTIIGHTPTVYLNGEGENPFHMWYGNSIIDIDCGCGNLTEKRRLGCLRLDDMTEFYI